jgi:hypothetical protein
MESIKIDYRYIKGYPHDNFNSTGQLLPSSYAMAWCMLATHTWRIFTREDMKEFLFRLSITLHSLELVENWFLKDKLMNFIVKDKHYSLSLDEINMHFGFEVIDGCDNMHPRERYLDNVAKGIRDAMFVSGFEGFSVISPRITGDDEFEISAKSHAPEITPDLIKKADFFASDLMKFIPEKTFTDISPELIEKERELAERRQKIRNLLVFDINKIPADVVGQCFNIMFNQKFAGQLLTNKEEFERTGKPMLYLAWLWANNLMTSDGVFAHEKEGIHLTYEDYVLEDGGINLLVTIERHNIEDTIPLLKGLF